MQSDWFTEIDHSKLASSLSKGFTLRITLPSRLNTGPLYSNEEVSLAIARVSSVFLKVIPEICKHFIQPVFTPAATGTHYNSEWKL